MDLPIDSLLPEIAATLRVKRRLILGAPPGAGKTTRVPLALAGLIPGLPRLPGKIIVLEPRRIAARMAAQRMADTIGEPLGKRIGLSTRIDRRVSNDTRIEVITDGLFTRRVLADPELSGVSAVIFDEIHERSLSADLGLALAREVQSALRDDLHLLAMSATLNTDELADRFNAPVIESDGRQYPVETRYLGRSQDRLDAQMARAIERAVRETDGSILAFLPGAGEIRRTAERLSFGDNIVVAPLFGALSPQDQDAAIQPCVNGQRKIVLATDIAESALTIQGVSVVIDSGLARVPVYVPGGLSTELRTQRATRANVDQRRGRAGRLGPGICYRLWDEAETRGLTAAPTPDIQIADLSGLCLTLADWGNVDAAALDWLTPPPLGRLQAAREDLTTLGALNEAGQLTKIGKEMAQLPLSPRLAALLVKARTPEMRALGAQIAAVVSERGMGGNSDDLNARLANFQRDQSPRSKTLKRQAARWSHDAKPAGRVGDCLANGWPDAIARKRAGTANQYVLASGRGGQVDEASPLAKSDWLVVADMTGSARSARITLATAIDESTALRASDVETKHTAKFDPDRGTFTARRVKAIGAIVLSEQPLPKPPTAIANQAFLDHIKTHGFEAIGLSHAICTLLARITHLRSVSDERWPDWTETTLAENVEDWLAPVLDQHTFTRPSVGKVTDALKAQLDWPLPQTLDQKAPTVITLPSGRKAKIDWLDERAPLIECKVQELYGASQRIALADGRIPVTVQMLSPGGKPVATTQDLPQFWQSGYLDMAKDMRGRYPKHDWPEDPACAKPHAGVTKARLAKS
ncbi:MAG: ATP-dependent helicase HrpB [Pseudomonadota bacterium]